MKKQIVIEVYGPVLRRLGHLPGAWVSDIDLGHFKACERVWEVLCAHCKRVVKIDTATGQLWGSLHCGD